MNEAWQLTVTHYSCACQTTEDSNSPSLTKLEERTLLVKEVSGKSSIRESDEHNVLLSVKQLQELFEATSGPCEKCLAKIELIIDATAA